MKAFRPTLQILMACIILAGVLGTSGLFANSEVSCDLIKICCEDLHDEHDSETSCAAASHHCVCHSGGSLYAGHGKLEGLMGHIFSGHIVIASEDNLFAQNVFLRLLRPPIQRA